MRIVRQDDFRRPLARRHVFGRQDAQYALHRERLAGVDAGDSGVRHGREQQLAEHHALDAKVFGVFRPAGYLAAEIRRREVLS